MTMLMPIIWGSLEILEQACSDSPWIQIRAVLPEGGAIRARMFVGKETLIARGVERVELSSLREGELVEVSFHRGRAGFIEVDTIYVRSDRLALA